MTEHEAWDEIARIAKEHELIVHAYGGRMLLATTIEQTNMGIRQRVADKYKSSEQKRKEREAAQ